MSLLAATTLVLVIVIAAGSGLYWVMQRMTAHHH